MSDGGLDENALGRLHGALAVAGLASWTLDPGTGRLTWTEGGFESPDWRPGNLFPSIEAWLERIHPDDRPSAAATLAAARSARGFWRHDHRVLLPGSRIIWCRAAGQAHTNETNGQSGMTGVLRDISAEAILMQGDAAPPSQLIAEDRNRILLKELQHRVRNSMATVRSIARHSMAGGRGVEDYVEHLDGRIAAYARVQSAAIQDPLAGLDLELLLRDALAVPAVPERQIHVEGPTVSLRPRVAEQLAIAFHELATNALTHGALRSERGRVVLSWRWEPETDGRLSFRWAETTAEPLGPEGPPGFGTEFLTRALVYTLKARVDMVRTPSGVVWEIAFPDPVASRNTVRDI